MAEVTKRKIASIYSLITGFILSLFSGHVHAGELFKTTTSKPVGTTRQAPAVYRTTTTVNPDTVSSGLNQAPAPNTISSGLNQTPAPNITAAGLNQSPAPGFNSTNTELMNAQMIEDAEAREFIINKADAQGIDSTNLPRDFVNTTMIEYLMKEVAGLKTQLQNK
ncbi:MAG TPA: hypothetical protein VFX30_13125 [bacterium]|nr:hypothetical protein [bacterium]